MDVFGSYSRLAKPNSELNERFSLEQAVADSLARENSLLIPSFGDNGRVYFKYKYPDEYCGNGRIFQKIDDLSGGLIIPYDFVEIPENDFSNPTEISGLHNSYVYKDINQKFIARPDFFYVQNIDGNAHLFPVDVKGGYDTCNVDEIKQISQFNTAMLYFHSNYFFNIIEYLRNNGYEDIIFENGFILKTDKVKILNEGLEGLSDRETGMNLNITMGLFSLLSYYFNFSLENGDYFVHERESRFTQGRIMLEDYIKENLKKSISHKLSENVFAGIILKSNSLKLAIEPDEFFVSDIDYSASAIKETELLQRIMFAKNRLRPYTVYQNAIQSINGFNGDDRPINRFHYHPASYIDTGYPDLEALGNQIHNLWGLTDDEIMDRRGTNIVTTSYDLLIKSSQKELTIVDKKIKTKIHNRLNSQKKKERSNKYTKNRIKYAGESKSAIRRYKKYQKDLSNLYSKKNSILSRINILLQESQKEKERLYKANLIEKGSKRWSQEAFDIRKQQIEKLEKEREMLLQRKLKWKMTDSDNLDNMDMFVKNLEQCEGIRLAQYPIFDIPTEYYLQLDKKEPYKVLAYSSVPLIKTSDAIRHIYNS